MTQPQRAKEHGPWLTWRPLVCIAILSTFLKVGGSLLNIFFKVRKFCVRERHLADHMAQGVCVCVCVYVRARVHVQVCACVCAACMSVLVPTHLYQCPRACLLLVVTAAGNNNIQLRVCLKKSDGTIIHSSYPTATNQTPTGIVHALNIAYGFPGNGATNFVAVFCAPKGPGKLYCTML